MLVGGLQAPTHMVQSLERFTTGMLDPVLGSFQPFSLLSQSLNMTPFASCRRNRCKKRIKGWIRGEPGRCREGLTPPPPLSTNQGAWLAVRDVVIWPSVWGSPHTAHFISRSEGSSSLSPQPRVAVAGLPRQKQPGLVLREGRQTGRQTERQTGGSVSSNKSASAVIGISISARP